MASSRDAMKALFREAYDAIQGLGFSAQEAARFALPVLSGTPVDDAIAMAMSMAPAASSEASATDTGDIDMACTATGPVVAPVPPSLTPAVAPQPPPVVVGGAGRAPPADGLTYAEFTSVYSACAASGSFGPVIRLLGMKLRSYPEVNNSFTTAETPECPHGLDIAQVERFYDMVATAPSDGVRASLCNALQGYAAEALLAYRSFTTPDMLRQFLFVSLNPMLTVEDYQETVCPKLYRCVDRLPDEMKDIFSQWLQSLPEAQFRTCITHVQAYMTRCLTKHTSVFEIEPPVVFAGLLNAANEGVYARTGARVVPYDSFYNARVSNDISLQDDYGRWLAKKRDETGHLLFSFCAHEYVLDASAKALILRLDSDRQMAASRGTGLMALMESPHLKLLIRRSHILEDALDQIVHVSPKTLLKKQLMIKFDGEDGIDQGGVKKEFFQILTSRMFDPGFGMFVVAEDGRTLWFNAHSFEPSIQFEMIGSLLGLAIYNSVILELSFPMVVYRKLVGQKPSLRDLCAWKPEVGRGLTQLLAYDGADFEDVFTLNFTISTENFGAMVTVELKPGGETTMVSQANKQEYVDLYVDYLLTKSIAVQFDAFYRGFMNVADGPALKLFRAEELEQLVVGSKTLDFVAWEGAARYEEPYGPEHPTITQFWSIVRAFTEEERKQLLSFCTGSHRAPIKGLGALRLIVGRAGPDTDQLPTSHTCFNHLLLPEYSSKEKMEAKLRLAIAQSEGFGLI